MKFDCFYKVRITKNNKTEIYHWGYFPYKMVLADVEKHYQEGADAVELEMISQDQFDKEIEQYTNPTVWYNNRKKRKK